MDSNRRKKDEKTRKGKEGKGSKNAKSTNREDLYLTRLWQRYQRGDQGYGDDQRPRLSLADNLVLDDAQPVILDPDLLEREFPPRGVGVPLGYPGLVLEGVAAAEDGELVGFQKA